MRSPVKSSKYHVKPQVIEQCSRSRSFYDALRWCFDDSSMRDRDGPPKVVTGAAAATTTGVKGSTDEFSQLIKRWVIFFIASVAVSQRKIVAIIVAVAADICICIFPFIFTMSIAYC